jgi:hypothetical protein
MGASADPFASLAAQLDKTSAPPPAQQPVSGAGADPFASLAAQLHTNASPDSQDKSFVQNYMDGGNPAASYGAATRYGFDTLASDTVDAVKGAANFLKPTPQSDDEKTAFDTAGLGGMYAHRIVSSLKSAASDVTLNPIELASTIHTINQSKDPTGAYLEAAQKFASKGAAQALTALGTEGVVKGVGAALPEAVTEEAASVPKKPNIIARTFNKTAASQPGAQAALRSGATASAADAGVEAGAQGGSIRSLLDDPIEALSKNERASYDTINKASGTDLKSLYDHANDVQDALDDPTNVANRNALQTELKTTQESISKGEAQATKNGVDPDTLNDAKNMTKQRYAMENINQKLFNNESVISGNTTHGAPESINVDSAIRQVENLDKPSKFAPRGTPSRLQQAFGSDGAQSLKQGLYDAQKAGNAAVTRATIAKWVAGAVPVLGGGYEVLKHF